MVKIEQFNIKSGTYIQTNDARGIKTIRNCHITCVFVRKLVYCNLFVKYYYLLKLDDSIQQQQLSMPHNTCTLKTISARRNYRLFKKSHITGDY